MKSLINWGKKLGLVGAIVLSSLGTYTLKALALPQEEIIKLFQPIPVFTIADDKGVPIVADGENNKKVTGVFISRQDAQQFFQQLQEKNPDLANQVKVQPVSLGEVYKLAQANAEKPDGLLVDYVPSQGEVESAKKLLTDSGQEYKGGVPLFVAKGGEEEGYLTVQENGEQIIPFFFDRAQLDGMIDRFKQEKPDLAATVKIEVIPLESVMATLQQSDDEMLKKIRLVPSQESIQYIRENVQQGQSNAQPQEQPNAQPEEQPQ